MKGEPTTFASLCRAETDELFISLNFRHKKTRFKRVVSFYVFQWLREPELMKGEPTTFAGLYRAETDELFISLNFRHKKTRFWRVDLI